jgi:predicted nuclease of predicted toxin-antitoxin system
MVGATVYRHREYFARGAKDYEWLPLVGRNGWIILTKDEAMQHGEIERVVIKNSNARVFILVRGDLTGQEMAEIFVTSLSSILRIVKRHPAPFIAKIYRNGSVVKTDYV